MQISNPKLMNPDWSKKNILFIEDDDISTLLVSEILTNTRAGLTHTSDAEQGVRTFSKAPDKFDLVIMDLRLPEMDGFEAMEKIKTINPKVPVIAHTAYFTPEIEQKCKDAGFDEFILKPVSGNHFMMAIQKYF